MDEAIVVFPRKGIFQTTITARDVRSLEHRQAKELVAAKPSRRLNAGLAMPWAFKDADASDYPLEGNLLFGTDHVATEHPLETPFGSKFQFDGVRPTIGSPATI